MRGTRQTWLHRAIGTIAWLLLSCAAGACTGPGVEPPGDLNESGGGRGEDAGDDLGSGGSAASGGAGAGGSGGVPTVDPGDGDGDGDGTDRDAGEASSDAGVDDDGGTDPDELEP